jgi:hypothetical protein
MSILDAKVDSYREEGPGFVYVYRDNWNKFGYLKVGYETISGDRLSQFRTWADGVLVYRQHFPLKKAAEKAVHVELAQYRVGSHKEVFHCSPSVAIDAIENVAMQYRTFNPGSEVAA